MLEIINTALKIGGSLAIFIFGMKLMSEAIQRAAGGSLRSILRRVTKNRVRGFFTGLVTTAAIQSSSATTVMTVSLVNAGLITLVESGGLMMGANVGTTSTAWILTQLGFRFDVFNLCYPLFLIGVPMIFYRRGKVKFWGECFIGIAILFIGLHFLQDAVPEINVESDFVAWIRSLSGSGILTRLLFVIIGALMTIIIQSSSAAIILTITICLKGWIPYELGACLVMGENIGTTITAEVASLVGNVYARRSARIHTLFNVFGVLWMVILLPYFLDAVTWILSNVLHQPDPHVDTKSVDFGLALFHTSFNVVNALIFLPLLGWLIHIANRTVRQRDEEDALTRLKFFSTGTRTPELAIMELKKEIAKYSDIVRRMHSFSADLFGAYKKKDRKRISKRIVKYEQITNKLEEEISSYIASVSREEMSLNTSINLRSMLHICDELERIGDTYYKLVDDIEYKVEHNIWINPTQRNNIKHFLHLIGNVFSAMVENLQTERYKDADLGKTQEAIYSAEVYSRHIKNPIVMTNVEEDGDEEHDFDDEVNLKGAVFYDNTLFQYIKILDHCKNIVGYIKGEV